ncbi:Trm112p-domain-containing protein, partial [Chytridium lagenaria]
LARLIVHNVLMCNAKGCTSNNYPLKIEEAELETLEVEYNENFLRRFLVKLDWPALVQTAFLLGIDQLPQDLPVDFDEELLGRLHRIIMETDVKSGRMVCPSCGHIYPIKDGIPNIAAPGN